MKSSWKLATFDAQIQILVAYTNEGKTLTKVYAGEIFRKAYLLFAFYRYIFVFLHLNFQAYTKKHD